MLIDKVNFQKRNQTFILYSSRKIHFYIYYTLWLSSLTDRPTDKYSYNTWSLISGIFTKKKYTSFLNNRQRNPALLLGKFPFFSENFYMIRLKILNDILTILDYLPKFYLINTYDSYNFFLSLSCLGETRFSR